MRVCISISRPELFLIGLFLFSAGRARELTKKIMRKQFIEALENTREEDIKNFVDCILDEGVQKAIGMQIEKLSKKK